MKKRIKIKKPKHNDNRSAYSLKKTNADSYEEIDNISNVDLNFDPAWEVLFNDSLDSFNLSDELNEDIMNLSQNSDDKPIPTMKRGSIKFNPFVEDIKIT